MRLSQLLEEVDVLDRVGADELDITSLSFDSRRVQPGDLYVAVPGTQVDGHSFINRALEAGATAVVCERLPEALAPSVAYLQTRSSSKALGVLASNYFGRPSRRLALVGVTGTNGKTTTVTLLHRLSEAMGYRSGLFSTAGNRVSDRVVSATHTTPDPIQLNEIMRQMVDDGCSRCFMEVSSHAVVQNRIAGLRYRGGVYTNLTPEHLDYHLTMDAYFAAKKSFFDALDAGSFALTNLDDQYGTAIVANTNASVATYGLKHAATFNLAIISNTFAGLVVDLDGLRLNLRLLGRFNGYNALASYATARLLGDESREVATLLERMDPIEGRVNRVVTQSGITGVVDFAHTPDAVANVLSSLREASGDGRLIIVIGCGGDRDREKRPHMARLASEMSDYVILTSDNPRSEDPRVILSQMEAGIAPENRGRVTTLVDREQAIAAACSRAEPGDLVLVAGKGHEKYQETAGVRIPFDDMAILKRHLGVEG